jgi:hypothetical protein
MDLLTTIIGVTWFGAVESNPFIADAANSNLLPFAALKLTATILIGLFFYLGERTLRKTQYTNIRPYQYTRTILKTACITVTALLLIAVANNIIVVATLI